MQKIMLLTEMFSWAELRLHITRQNTKLSLSMKSGTGHKEEITVRYSSSSGSLLSRQVQMYDVARLATPLIVIIS